MRPSASASPLGSRPRHRYCAVGPAGESELGLAYLREAQIPEVPQPVLGGCAAPAANCATLSLPDEERVIILDLAAGRVLASHDIKGVRSLWSAGDGWTVAASPDHQKLVLLHVEGHRREVRLPGVYPWHAARWRDGWLVVDAVSRSIVLASDTGKSTCLSTPWKLLTPRAAIPVDDTSYLFCDRDGQVAARLNLQGHALWVHGAWEAPSADDARLTNPEHIARVHRDAFVICDVRNSRLVTVTTQGVRRDIVGGCDRVGSRPGHLWAPLACAASERGLLVADSGNGRLVEVTESGAREVWGRATIATSLFHHPRSADQTPTGNIVVADSYRNRAIEIDPVGVPGRCWSEALGQAFFWPRNVLSADSGLVVSDGRNGRILRYRPEGPQALRLHAAGTPITLRDPHAVRQRGRHWIITDTAAGMVLLCAEDGEIRQTFGVGKLTGTAGVELDLDDVHDADLGDDGDIWITDTGHHRLLRVCLVSGRIVGCIEGCGAQDFQLPKSIEAQPDGSLLVADSNNHRVVRLTPDGCLIASYGGRFGHAAGHLAYPRQARGLPGGRALIADYLNNRVLSVQI